MTNDELKALRAERDAAWAEVCRIGHRQQLHDYWYSAAFHGATPDPTLREAEQRYENLCDRYREAKGIPPVKRGRS